jgi:CheY-like chemotaxis protein
MSASRRILLVEDNADACESLAMLLTLSGHTTETAATWPEGLEKAELFQPEVVLMNANMVPITNACEAARRRGAQPGDRQLLMIALTGVSDSAGSLEAGFDIHLQRPADLEMLTGLLAADDRAAPGVREKGQTRHRKPRREFLLRRLRKGR